MYNFTFKAFLSLIIILLSTSCHTAQEPSLEEIDSLKTQVQRPSPPAFVQKTENDLKVWATTKKLYELRGFRPLWIAQGQTTARVDSLIRTFESTEAEGFSAEDLGMADLSAKVEAIKTSKELPQVIDFDMYFTYSLVRCASYLSSGRADPRTIDPNWRWVPRNDNLVQIINDAIDTNTLEALPNLLSPPHHEYVTLKAMLGQYRLIGEKGGWTPLPATLALKPGESDPSVVVLRKNLVITGDLKTASSDSAEFDNELVEAVRHFEARHGLEPDGLLDPKLIETMNVPVIFRIAQIEANLERLRWLPNDMGTRHIVVNIPAYELQVHEGEQVPLTMKVVVGTNANRTPLFSDLMETLVFSPYWNIPESIATKEILPKIMKDPDYRLRQNIEVVKVGRTSEVVDPSKINWDAAPADFQYQLRQKPGAQNSLGLVKFLFPNEFNVYLHDTPADNLFDRYTRNFSHGCVRVEKPADLAAYLLRDQPEWTPEKIETAMHSNKETHVALKATVPVHIVYWTAWVDVKGLLQIRPDVYGYGYPARAAAEAKK
jgi:murein L,D-transpeptidase YcbB/YkuD